MSDKLTADGPVYDEMSLLGVATTILQGRRTILRLTALATFIGMMSGLLLGDTYRSSGSFIPQEADATTTGGLASLAGQLGVSIPGGGGANTPEFYEDLLSTRKILFPVLMSEYSYTATDGSKTSSRLLELTDPVGDTEDQKIEYGLVWLRENIASSINIQAGTVDFSVFTDWPEISFGVAVQLIEEINSFNQNTRQSQAEAERTFLEGRLEQAAVDLLANENQLEGFLEANRSYNNSPELVFEHDRLQRQVEMRQAVYTTLVQAFEEARIQEVRNTPVITVIEQPIVPPTRQPHGTRLRMVIGMILGALSGTAITFLRTGVGDETDPDAIALRNALGDVRTDLFRLFPTRRS